MSHFLKTILYYSPCFFQKMALKSVPIFITQATKKFKKKIRVGLTPCLFIKKGVQTRVSRIGNDNAKSDTNKGK